MGKRKKSSRKPQGPKKKEPLATSFPCLFCNHEKSVAVKLDKKAGAGLLTCKVCGQSFQTGINYLSAAVDVYAEWIDACDAVAKNDARNAGGRGRPFPDEDGQDGPRATGEYVPGGDYDEYGEEGIEGAGREKELYADE